MLVTEYLKNASLADIKRDHNVKHRFSSDGSKVSLNYDILASSGDAIAEHCRGLVLRPLNACKDVSDVFGDSVVVAWPMNRFYNSNDPACCVDFNDTQLRCYEKLDGTMIALYWDTLQDKWCAATRSVPEADVPIDGLLERKTFSELAFETLRIGNVDLVLLDRELTYVFELTSNLNRVVVSYGEQRMTLITARVTSTGEELDVLNERFSMFSRPRLHAYTSLSELTSFVSSMDTLDEGFVVVDSVFRRAKVKNAAWITASRAKSRVASSPRAMLDCIISGNMDDVRSLLDSDRMKLADDLSSALVELSTSTDNCIRDILSRSNNDRRAYAAGMNASSSSFMKKPAFAILDKKASSTMDWLQLMSRESKLTSVILDSVLDEIAARHNVP